MPNYKAVLFDLDGTLVDTAPDFIYALNHQRKLHDLPPLDETRIRNTVSDGARALTRLGFGGEPEEPEFEAKRLELLDIYKDCVGNWATLFQGMDKLIDHLVTEQINWGVVTNKPRLYTDLLFERMNMDHAPEVVICPDEVSKAKPDPESLFLACEQLGHESHSALYVGDHERDIVAGRAADMKTVAVSFGFIMDTSVIPSWQADFIVDHPEEIIALL